jgi:hypothetical protein
MSSQTKQEVEQSNLNTSAVIEVLCQAIDAVNESDAPQAFEVNMKIVSKIANLIDKIQ